LFICLYSLCQKVKPIRGHWTLATFVLSKKEPLFLATATRQESNSKVQIKSFRSITHSWNFIFFNELETLVATFSSDQTTRPCALQTCHLINNLQLISQFMHKFRSIQEYRNNSYYTDKFISIHKRHSFSFIGNIISRITKW
jgi:hypothetical protein